ncbi:Brp/Blh family beta-carotene 15,15'-dioxygenase [Natronorarus salvus]|uniref:Brp/Blh family beta-carotene 15,15'-dioxygenase n=1 Tax=Natronorarus salvus TaxID=3117733 RepID=UPI002F262D5D
MAVTSSSASALPTARRLTLYPGWAVLAVAAVPFVLGAELPLVYQYLPLVASVLLLGLLHGAVDHLLLPRVRGEALTVRWLAIVGLVYLLVGLAFLAVWFFAPALAFVLFVALALAHWGQGDVYPLVALYGTTHLRTTVQRVLAAAVRGSMPMLVPLVAFPDQYAFVAGTLIGLFDPAAAETLVPAFTPEGRLVVAGVLTLLALAHLGLGYRRAGGTRAWRVDAGDIVGLLAFFAVVPPVLAVGLYFCVWHSLRHVTRVALLDPESKRSFSAGLTLPALSRFARDAAPLTALSFVFLLGLAALVPATPVAVADLVALYLVFVATLTAPHVLLVSWLDREEGIWSG